jgi:hypothetical protein
MGDSQYGFYYFTTFSRKDDSTYISVTQVRSDPYYEEILLAYKDLKPDFLIYTSTDGIILNYGRQLSHSMIPYQEIDIGEEVQLHLFLKGYLGTTLTIKRLALHEFTVNGHVLTKESFNVYRAASTALHYWLRYYGDCQEPARVQGTTTRTSRSIDSLQILQTGMNTYSAFGTIRLTCEQEYNNQRGQVPPVREQVNYPFRLDIAIEEEESTIFNIEVDHNHYDSTQFYYQYFSLPSSWATVFDESNRWSHSLKVNGN